MQRNDNGNMTASAPPTLQFRHLLRGELFRLRPGGPVFARDRTELRSNPGGDSANYRWLPLDMDTPVIRVESVSADSTATR